MAYPTFKFGEDDFLGALFGKDEVVEVGVSVDGPAAAYAEVWEWGNARQTKQGPRTVLGTNPDGEQVWLSSQAPYGYIRINTEKYLEAARKALGKLPFHATNPKQLTEELQKAGVESMKECVQILHDAAPVDTGQLQSSFHVVEDGDELLDSDPGGRIESRFNRVLNLTDRL